MPLHFRNDLTQEIVRELLDYNPLTGALIWRHRSRSWFPEPNSYILWNSAHAGKPALISRGARGCLRGTICNKTYSAHRVVWLHVTGHWPKLELDHINRNPADNRWSNLRAVTRQENARNQSLRRDNKSGFIGVGLHRSGRYYYARIGKKHLGLFASKGEAMAARAAANKALGYSPGHGRARLIATRKGYAHET